EGDGRAGARALRAVPRPAPLGRARREPVSDADSRGGPGRLLRRADPRGPLASARVELLGRRRPAPQGRRHKRRADRRASHPLDVGWRRVRRRYFRWLNRGGRFYVAFTFTVIVVSYVAVPFVVRFIDAVDDFNPIYYDPKDFERQAHLDVCLWESRRLRRWGLLLHFL